jgi:cell division protein FtsB
MSTDLIFENAQLKGRVITLDAEVKCLEAVIRAHERVDCLSVTSLKKQLVEADAENARLKASLEKSDNLVVKMSDKISILKAECQARQAENSVLAVECDSLKAQVERLTKAGDALAGEAIRLEYSNYWSEYEKVEDVCIDEVEAWHNAKGVQS